MMRMTLKRFFALASVIFVVVTYHQYHSMIQAAPHLETHGGHKHIKEGNQDLMCPIPEKHVHNACLFAIIPTIPRSKARVSYLNQTIMSWVDSYPRDGLTCFHLTVVNLRPGQHPIFDEVKAFHAGDDRIRFVERKTPRTDLKVDDANPPMGKWRPTVNRDVLQSRDTIELFEEARDHLCSAKMNPAGYVMLLEDDVLMCPNGPEHILYAIDSANRRYGKNGWAVLRLSMGLIGVILRCGDMDAFVKYTVDHIYDGPIDYVLPEFWNQIDQEGKDHFKDRVYSAYRYNLFDHVGRVSSFPGRTEEKGWDDMRRRYHRCFDVLSSLLHGRDMFQLHCIHSDLSPCSDPKITFELDSSESKAARSKGKLQDYFRLDAPRIVKERHMTGDDSGLLLSPYHPRIRPGRLDLHKTKNIVYHADPEAGCTTTCQNIQKQCKEDLFWMSNNCFVIQDITDGCQQCVISPSQYLGLPGINVKTPYCETSAVDGLMTCDDSSPGEQARICPCG